LFGQRLHCAALADPCLDVRDVAFFARAVDDDEDVTFAAHEHQVVDDAAGLVEQ
jgi:hypothetical protein